MPSAAPKETEAPLKINMFPTRPQQAAESKKRPLDDGAEGPPAKKAAQPSAPTAGLGHAPAPAAQYPPVGAYPPPAQYPPVASYPPQAYQPQVQPVAAPEAVTIPPEPFSGNTERITLPGPYYQQTKLYSDNQAAPAWKKFLSKGEPVVPQEGQAQGANAEVPSAYQKLMGGGMAQASGKKKSGPWKPSWSKDGDQGSKFANRRSKPMPLKKKDKKDRAKPGLWVPKPKTEEKKSSPWKNGKDRNKGYRKDSRDRQRPTRRRSRSRHSRSSSRGRSTSERDKYVEDLLLYPITIKNISVTNNASAVRDYFKDFGEICEVDWKRLTLDRGRVRVTFRTKKAQGRVLDARPHRINGNDVDVASDTPRANRIFIENLPTRDEDVIYDAFRPFGKIRDVHVVWEKRYGFVEFNRLSSTIKCLKKEMEIQGKPVDTSLAMAKLQGGSQRRRW